MGFVDKQLQDYLDELLPKFGGELRRIQQRAYDEALPIIPPHVAATLSVLLAAKRPSTVLEIGCGVGFSAALFAGFLADGGRVTTIERYDYMANRAEENFKKLAIGDKIRIIRSDAADALPELIKSGEKFEFIFMDCGKSQYLRFLTYCMDLMSTQGILAVDDVLQSGTVAWDFERITKRQRTTYRNMRQFLTSVMETQGYFSSVLPIGDGLLLCAKGD